MNLNVTPCSIEGAYLITPPASADLRGRFLKLFERDHYRQYGLPFSVQECFFSTSRKNVIRGIHFQLNEPQAKLVSILRGAIRDVIADLRPESATYGKWEAFSLTEENGRALYIPAGCGHGFTSLEDETTMLYLCDGKYDAATDTGIRFDDSDLAIDWGISAEEAVVSARDQALMSFRAYREIADQRKASPGRNES